MKNSLYDYISAYENIVISCSIIIAIILTAIITIDVRGEIGVKTLQKSSIGELKCADVIFHICSEKSTRFFHATGSCCVVRGR